MNTSSVPSATLNATTRRLVDAFTCRGPAPWFLALLLAAGVAHAGVLSVPGDYPTIQDAVDAAVDGDEVVVANGTYFTDVDILNKSITLRSASDDPALCIIDPAGIGVQIVGATSDSVVRGFTIRNGLRGVEFNAFASGAITNCVIQGCFGGGVFMNGTTLRVNNSIIQNNTSSVGGGMNLAGGAVTIRNSVVRSNASTAASAFGGGILVGPMTTLVLVDSRISGNSAIGVNLGRGGGLYASGATNAPLAIANTEFVDNESSEQGGGLHLENCSAVLDNVEIVDNVSGAGGGIFIENLGAPANSVVIANALIAGNEATIGSGGGIRQAQDSTLTVTNATIMANASSAGGGGVANGPNSTATFTNCIVGGSSPNDFAGAGSTTVSWSNVEDGFVGIGNISTLPLFVNAAAGDYRLSAMSPCIDAGSTLTYRGPALDLDGNTRAVDDTDVPNTGFPLADGAIDMGAYERQTVDSCLADLDGNGVIDGADLGFVLGAWGACF